MRYLLFDLPGDCTMQYPGCFKLGDPTVGDSLKCLLGDFHRIQIMIFEENAANQFIL